jgi:hypothetical protein
VAGKPFEPELTLPITDDKMKLLPSDHVSERGSRAGARRPDVGAHDARCDFVQPYRGPLAFSRRRCSRALIDIAAALAHTLGRAGGFSFRQTPAPDLDLTPSLYPRHLSAAGALRLIWE